MSATELDKQDRERQERAQAFLRDSEKTQQARARELEKRRRENAAVVDDTFRVFEMRALGREAIDGHNTIVVSLTPRPGAKPRTREGKLLTRLQGRAWISESDYEVVRVEVEATRTISIGLGMLARLHKGSRLTFERTEVEDGVWLPASATYAVSARLALVKSVRSQAMVRFSHYRKFTVATDAVYDRHKP